jgi:hypothetical protein
MKFKFPEIHKNYFIKFLTKEICAFLSDYNFTDFLLIEKWDLYKVTKSIEKLKLPQTLLYFLSLPFKSHRNGNRIFKKVYSFESSIVSKRHMYVIISIIF